MLNDVHVKPVASVHTGSRKREGGAQVAILRPRVCAALLGLWLAGAAVMAAQAAEDAMQNAPAEQAASAVTEPLLVGMPYVVPPHVAGSKVRTPEGMAALLIEQLNKQVPVHTVAVISDASGGRISQNTPAQAPAVQLIALDAPARQNWRREGATVIPSGYRAGIMAIMRTDTDIQSWDDLRGRTVCLAQGSLLAGTMQARYGVTEKVFRAPADSLLDLRIGGCDAAVHDSTMLAALLEFPEWQKFSARLPVQDERDLVFVVDAGFASAVELLQNQVAQWQETELLPKLTRQAAQDIAFEVYMDQEVPDCH